MTESEGSLVHRLACNIIVAAKLDLNGMRRIKREGQVEVDHSTAALYVRHAKYQNLEHSADLQLSRHSQHRTTSLLIIYRPTAAEASNI